MNALIWPLHLQLFEFLSITQVEDIHKRFADLQKLKDCNWKDENIPPVKAQSVKKTKPSLAKKVRHCSVYCQTCLFIS